MARSPCPVPFANYAVFEKASTILQQEDFPHCTFIVGNTFSAGNSAYTFSAGISSTGGLSPFPKHLTVHLENDCPQMAPLGPVHFTVSLLDVKGGSHFTKGAHSDFLSTKIFSLKLIDSSIRVKVAVEALILEETDPVRASPILSGLSTLLDDFTCSDFLIAIPGKEYKVHKSILAARSPVFRAMLEGQFSESTENRVDFEKIDQQVLDSFIGYLYTDQITDIETNVDALIVLADKYQIESLLLKCGQHQCSQVSVESFCTLLALSQQHNVPNLKEACLKFFGDNSKEIVSLGEWDTFTGANLPLLPSLLKVSVLNQ